MREFRDLSPIEIQQGLLLMIHEYGLTNLLDAFSELVRRGNLGPIEDRRLQSIASYLAFASAESSEREAPPMLQDMALSEPVFPDMSLSEDTDRVA